MLDHCKNINLTFNAKVIERVDVFKYLGIKFDSDMSLSSHIYYLSGNVSKRIDFVKRVKYFLPQETLITLANALVIPHFDYASSVGSNCSATDQAHLQVKSMYQSLNAISRITYDTLTLTLENFVFTRGS